MNIDIDRILLKESRKSLKHGDVPVGALIIYKGKVIAKAHNTREKEHNVLGHAEINCVLKAAKKLKTWHLDQCDMYITLKPCSICTDIIKNSRINSIYYYLDKPITKKEYDKTQFMLINNKFSTIYSNMLSQFFKAKRK